MNAISQTIPQLVQHLSGILLIFFAHSNKTAIKNKSLPKKARLTQSEAFQHVILDSGMLPIPQIEQFFRKQENW